MRVKVIESRWFGPVGYQPRLWIAGEEFDLPGFIASQLLTTGIAKLVALEPRHASPFEQSCRPVPAENTKP